MLLPRKLCMYSKYVLHNCLLPFFVLTILLTVNLLLCKLRGRWLRLNQHKNRLQGKRIKTKENAWSTKAPYGKNNNYNMLKICSKWYHKFMTWRHVSVNRNHLFLKTKMIYKYATLTVFYIILRPHEIQTVCSGSWRCSLYGIINF